MSKFREVSKSEFDAYVNSYPRELNANVAGVCDPAMVTYNDFTLGQWPESIVAKIMLCSEFPDCGLNKYYIPEGGAR